MEKQKRRLTEILVSGDERRVALMCVIQRAVLLFAGFCKVFWLGCDFIVFLQPRPHENTAGVFRCWWPNDRVFSMFCFVFGFFHP